MLPTDNNNKTNFILGHSRLVTNGFVDNQPIYRNDLILIHNGIITNCEDLWINGRERKQKIDSEIIAVKVKLVSSAFPNFLINLQNTFSI